MECIINFPENFTRGVVKPVGYTTKWCKKESCPHTIWIYPLHLGASLLTISLMPIVALINLIVAGIFKLMTCATDEEESTVNWGYAFEQASEFSWLCIYNIYILTLRIFYPPFEINE